MSGSELKAGCQFCHSGFNLLIEMAAEFDVAPRYIYNFSNCVHTSYRSTHESFCCTLKKHPFYPVVEAALSFFSLSSFEAANVIRCHYAKKAVSTHNREERRKWLNELEASSGLFMCRTRLNSMYVKKGTSLITFMHENSTPSSTEMDPSNVILYDNSDSPHKSPCVFSLKKNEGDVYSWELAREELKIGLQQEMERLRCGGLSNHMDSTYMEIAIEDTLGDSPLEEEVESSDEEDDELNSSHQTIDVEGDECNQQSPNSSCLQGDNVQLIPNASPASLESDAVTKGFNPTVEAGSEAVIASPSSLESDAVFKNPNSPVEAGSEAMVASPAAMKSDSVFKNPNSPVEAELEAVLASSASVESDAVLKNPNSLVDMASEAIHDSSAALHSDDVLINHPNSPVEAASEALLNVSDALELDEANSNPVVNPTLLSLSNAFPAFEYNAVEASLIHPVLEVVPSACPDSTIYPKSSFDEATVAASKSFINLIAATNTKSTVDAVSVEAHRNNVNVVVDEAHKSLDKLVAIASESAQSHSLDNIPIDEGSQLQHNEGDAPYSPSDSPFSEMDMETENEMRAEVTSDAEGGVVNVDENLEQREGTNDTHTVTYPTVSSERDSGKMPHNIRYTNWSKNKGEKRKNYEDTQKIQNEEISSSQGRGKIINDCSQEVIPILTDFSRYHGGAIASERHLDHYSDHNLPNDMIKEKRLKIKKEVEEKVEKEEKEEEEEEEEEESKDEKMMQHGNWNNKKRRDDEDPTGGSGTSGSGSTQGRWRQFFHNDADGPHDQGDGNGTRQYENAGNGGASRGMVSRENQAESKETDDQLKLQAYVDFEQAILEAAVKKYQDASAFHQWGLRMQNENRIYILLGKKEGKQGFGQTMVWRKAKYSNKRIPNRDETKHLSPQSKKERLAVDKWLDQAELLVNETYKFRRTIGEAAITVM